jgi:hypothetical protein
MAEKENGLYKFFTCMVVFGQMMVLFRLLHRVEVICSNVSEEHTASIFRVAQLI